MDNNPGPPNVAILDLLRRHHSEREALVQSFNAQIAPPSSSPSPANSPSAAISSVYSSSPELPASFESSISTSPKSSESHGRHSRSLSLPVVNVEPLIVYPGFPVVQGYSSGNQVYPRPQFHRQRQHQIQHQGQHPTQHLHQLPPQYIQQAAVFMPHNGSGPAMQQPQTQQQYVQQMQFSHQTQPHSQPQPQMQTQHHQQQQQQQQTQHYQMMYHQQQAIQFAYQQHRHQQMHPDFSGRAPPSPTPSFPIQTHFSELPPQSPPNVQIGPQAPPLPKAHRYSQHYPQMSNIQEIRLSTSPTQPMPQPPILLHKQVSHLPMHLQYLQNNPPVPPRRSSSSRPSSTFTSISAPSESCLLSTPSHTHSIGSPSNSSETAGAGPTSPTEVSEPPSKPLLKFDRNILETIRKGLDLASSAPFTPPSVMSIPVRKVSTAVRDILPLTPLHCLYPVKGSVPPDVWEWESTVTETEVKMEEHKEETQSNNHRSDTRRDRKDRDDGRKEKNKQRGSVAKKGFEVNYHTSQTTAEAPLDINLANRELDVDAILKSDGGARGHVMANLFETERNYLRDLEVIQNVFRERLNRIFSKTSASLIFGGIDELHAFHQLFYSQLEDSVSSWNNATSGIGDLFLRHKDEFNVYKHFMQLYSGSQAQLRLEEKSSSEYRAFMKECMASPATNRQHLKDFLILPVQRTTRYQLLLKDLLKYTPLDHPDYTNLTQALAQMHEMAASVNESKQHEEETTAMFTAFEMTKNCPPILISARRRLIMQVDVQETRVIHKTVHFSLFSDLLMIATLTSRRRPVHEDSYPLYKFYRWLDLRDILVTDEGDGIRVRLIATDQQNYVSGPKRLTTGSNGEPEYHFKFVSWDAKKDKKPFLLALEGGLKRVRTMPVVESPCSMDVDFDDSTNGHSRSKSMQIQTLEAVKEGVVATAVIDQRQSNIVGNAFPMNLLSSAPQRSLSNSSSSTMSTIIGVPTDNAPASLTSSAILTDSTLEIIENIVLTPEEEQK